MGYGVVRRSGEGKMRGTKVEGEREREKYTPN